jgi:hypothetical protein
MRFVTVAPALLPSLRQSLLALCFLGGLANLHAQYGVSPSQTGMFFDDLRARAENRQKTGGVRQGEGVYDFSQEGFAIGPDGTPMGPLEEASRQVNQGYTATGSYIYSQRQAGDYTQYSGPYPSSGDFFAPAYTSDPYLGGKRNLKVGPVNVGLGLTGTFEYNDNITRSGEDPTEEAIAGLYLNVSANYPISETNSLTISTAIGFDHYFMHPEVSPYGEEFVLNVLPGSTISFDGKLGPVYYVIYDRMSVRPAVQNDFALNNTEIFGVFQNDAGIGAAWAINSSLNLSVNYMHSNAIALQDEDAKYDRTTDSIQASLAWSPGGTWTAGLEGSYTWVKYPEGYNNDGTLATAGAFFAMPVGNSTYFRVAGGIQSFEFEDPEEFKGEFSRSAFVSAQNKLNRDTARKAELEKGSVTPAEQEEYDKLTGDKGSIAKYQGLVNEQLTAYRSDNGLFNGSTNDSNDLSDYYFNATISNRLTSRISHALSFGHESALNTTSNFITADYVSYGVGIIAWRGSRLSLSGYYESAEESGGVQRTAENPDADGNAQTESLREDIDQWGMDAYLSHQFTSRLRGGIGYHYGVSESSQESRDYTQNSFNIDFSYLVNSKLSLSLGYRFFTTDADNSIYEFDQNRFVMSANYNF